MSKPPDAEASELTLRLQMRAATIQYLRLLEDELVAMRAIREIDRAVMTRRERRIAAQQAVVVDIEPPFAVE